RGSTHLAAKNPELMAQHQDLHLFGVSGPEHPDHEFDETHDTRVHERPQHRLDILSGPLTDKVQDANQCEIDSEPAGHRSDRILEPFGFSSVFVVSNSLRLRRFRGYRWGGAASVWV